MKDYTPPVPGSRVLVDDGNSDSAYTATYIKYMPNLIFPHVVVKDGDSFATSFRNVNSEPLSSMRERLLNELKHHATLWGRRECCEAVAAKVIQQLEAWE